MLLVLRFNVCTNGSHSTWILDVKFWKLHNQIITPREWGRMLNFDLFTLNLTRKLISSKQKITKRLRRNSQVVIWKVKKQQREEKTQKNFLILIATWLLQNRDFFNLAMTSRRRWRHIFHRIRRVLHDLSSKLSSAVDLLAPRRRSRSVNISTLHSIIEYYGEKQILIKSYFHCDVDKLELAGGTWSLAVVISIMWKFFLSSSPFDFYCARSSRHHHRPRHTHWLLHSR